MQAAEYWDGAMDIDTYLEQMTLHHDLFIKRIFDTEITEADRKTFGREPLRFLALTEDFCPDSAQFIPPVAKLAQEIPTVEIRLLLRDQHRELASNYRRKDGYQAIPVLIALDRDGTELGYLVERPQRVHDELARESGRFAKAHPELEGVNRNYDKMPPETKAAVRANANDYREQQQPLWTRWLFEDLAAAIAEGIETRDGVTSAR
jgi:hypothetical protein